MTRKIILFVFLVVTSLTYEAVAQDASTRDFKSKAKTDKWEVGLHLGHTAITGDVDWNSSFGVGLFVRKSLDHIFSFRLDAGYYSFKGEEEENIREVDADRYHFAANWLPEYESSLLGAELTLLASLNQFKFAKKRKVNPYLFVGAGAASTKVTALGQSPVDNRDIEFDVIEDIGYDDEWDISAYITGGAGLGFRLSDKVSLTIEHKLMRVLGRGNDLMDAVEWRGTVNDKVITPSEDLAHYTNIRLGIALGKKDATEPLWWSENPLDLISEDIAELKARPILDLSDDDEDGVINMLDQEPESEKGYPVDTRGVALDSDGDGYADGKDAEPYSPIGYEIDSKGVAQVPQPNILNEADVNKIVDAKIALIDLGSYASKADWFLPMIHFNLDKYSIKNSEYGKLHQVAQVMKLHPNLTVVAAGHTDRLSGNCYNDVLSYNRANAAIDYMVSKYGIDRNRFILNWGGENTNLIPTNSGNMMNRRVEFTVTNGETEMGRPDCGVGSAGSGGSGTKYSGNKEAGY